ncbi:MAG: type II toxin-antitoxin system RelE/ParE family toxin [Cyclobacteriaceae bacterium]|nr:type II toxin-antitoxin system RelE/ParE family toxin [Cyclobacteriaceae bacterium]
MVKLRKIIWDDEAKKSLRSIYDYIKVRESASTAIRVRGEIIKQIKSLPLFPEKFAREPYFINHSGNVRFKVIWSYKIIYEITDRHILILDIFHTSRNPSEIESKDY